MSEFSEKLKKLRKAAGYTQSEVARRLEVSASAIGMYEQGRREPDMEFINKLCEFYKVTPTYLMNTEDNTPSEIDEVISSMREQLRQSDGLMFNGVPVSEEDTEKIFDAMKLAAHLIISQREEKEQSNSNANGNQENS